MTEHAVIEGGPPPNIGEVAQQVLGAMIATPVADGWGTATASRADGRPLYRIVVILGERNISAAEAPLAALSKIIHQAPDVFDELPMPLPETKPQSFRPKRLEPP